MTKGANVENIREMAFILLNGKDRDIYNLEKKVKHLETALLKANDINKKLDCKLKDCNKGNLLELINDLKQENKNLKDELKTRPKSIADFY